ncbi:phospholipid carrier-dependent glycosyltransferase [Curtobacterium aetherium]|uniref:phospholipid carrier-dependent glycosyltransferase n=1 Tax=Curtobacterium aetherium TaxID=2841594 RepID=UPI00209BB1C9|nr:glycosyltransferase family 39 protein [Curtobacterium sp. L6-1]
MSDSVTDTAPAAARPSPQRGPNGRQRLHDGLLALPDRIGRLLANPWTYRAALVVFVLMGVFFAGILHYPIVDGEGHVPYGGTIAPDEHRHLANILYYAGLPLTNGPVLHHIDPGDLAMGEMLRFPSYFYYYVMSFPVKPMVNAELPYSWIVIALRLANVVFGLLGLVVLRRLLRTMGFSTAVTVLSVIVLVLTGRYVWQSAAVSYDAPSMTLFLCCLLYCARFIREPRWGTLGAMVVTAGWTVLVKYTFLPFVGVAVVVAVGFAVQRDGWGVLAHPLRVAGEAIRTRTVRTVAWFLGFAVVAALLVERLGVNLLVYRQFNPDCSKLHTHMQCLTFAIYARNYDATRTHELAAANGTSLPAPDLLEFTGRWVTTYFQSVFFYRDRTTVWSVNPLVAALGSLVVIAAVLLVVLSFRRFFGSRTAAWGTIVTVVYIGATFVFNLRTLLQLDDEYAFSGRYVLPVVPILYALLIAAAVAAWRRLPDWVRAGAVVPALVAVAVLLLVFSAPTAFFEYARTPNWYTDTALDHLPRWLTGYTGEVAP